ncbi:MAG: helix-turn-helix domain-containing protein [Victivallales bacterium]
MTHRISAKSHFPREGDFCQVTINNLISGFPLHSHDYIEIVVILSGQAEHLINGKAYSVSSGDVYVMQGNQEHAFQNAIGDFSLCNVMYRPELVSFPFERLKTLPGYQALFVLEPARRSDSGFHSLLRLDGIRLKEALEKVQRLRLEMEIRSPGYDCTGQAYLLDLIVFLSRAYTSFSEDSKPGLLRFSEAIAWMEQNYMKHSTLPELARRAAMSERHFLRMFRKTFKTSPLEHMIHLRIRHAEKILQSGSHNITETAYACGFSDSNYFSRQFKRITGMSPRSYRHLP